MPAILGRLVKITAQKKLMVKLQPQSYEILGDRVHAATLKKFGTTSDIKRPLFMLENDDGDETAFCMVTLDKYDKQLMERKFEPLIRKDVAIEYKLAPYDFIPKDTQGVSSGQEDAVKGVNIQLTGIRLYKGKTPLFPEHHSDSSDSSDTDEDVEETTVRAEARETSVSSELNAEEQEIDAAVEQHIADTLPMLPPALVRQVAIGEAPRIRRRVPA